MITKLKKKVFFCSIMGLLISGSAMALPPGDFVPGVTLEIVLSGSDSQDQAIGLAVEDLCVDGTLDRYTESSNVGSFPGGHNAYFCTLDASEPAFGGALSSNTDAVIYKRSLGGPSQASIGLCGAGISSLDISAACVLDAGTGDYGCPNLVDRVSDAGISGLEFDRLPFGSGGEACDGIITETIPLYGTIYGVVATVGLRDALQLVQGLIVGSDDFASNMPTLSKQQIASFFSSGIPTWGDLLFEIQSVGNLTLLAAADNSSLDPSNQVNPSADPNAVFPPAFVAPRVALCRHLRVSDSGLQYAVKFHADSCVEGAISPTLDNTPLSTISSGFSNTAGSNPFGPMIVEVDSPESMATCLNEFESVGTWALGIQSLESNADLSDDYRFIKVDGVSPTVENVITNRYFDWVENVMTFRSATTGLTRSVLEALAARVGAVTNVANLPGAAHVALPSVAGNSPSIPLDVTNNPVATGTHTFLNRTNSCRTPYISQDSLF